MGPHRRKLSMPANICAPWRGHRTGVHGNHHGALYDEHRRSGAGWNSVSTQAPTSDGTATPTTPCPSGGKRKVTEIEVTCVAPCSRHCLTCPEAAIVGKCRGCAWVPCSGGPSRASPRGLWPGLTGMLGGLPPRRPRRGGFPSFGSCRANQDDLMKARGRKVPIVYRTPT